MILNENIMMNDNIPLIDLTTVEEIYFDTDEDEDVFGSSRSYRELYKKHIFKLKQNDVNFCMLNVRKYDLCEAVCDRIGFYLWRNLHIKNLTLSDCNLHEEEMEKLFSRIVDQHEQNETNGYIKEHDILGKILNVGDTSLAGHIMGYIAFTPFSKLVYVDLSQNSLGANGLDTLVKALGAGAPVTELNLNSNYLHDLSPLIVGARKLKRLRKLYLNNNELDSTDGNAEALSVLFDADYPHLKELYLEECGIDSALIEISAPSLSTNKTLRYLLLGNTIGEWGVEALADVLCDATSFKSILESNHTLIKVMATRDQSTWSEQKLQRLSMINLLADYGYIGLPLTEQKIEEMSYRKLIVLLAGYDYVDPAIVLHFDIGVLPHLFPKLFDCMRDESEEKEMLTAVYKVLKCQVFHVKLEMKIHDELKRKEEETRMRNEQLEADNAALLEENKRLKEQIASLLARNNTGTEIEQNVGSIADRVKMRKRGRAT